MRRALVPVDGSDHALEAVRHVIKLVRDGHPLDVHLLNAQPPLTGDVMPFVPPSAAQDYHLDEANRATRGACDLLDRAGIPYSKHIVIGHAARVIAEWARELRCDMVVIGTQGSPTMSQLLGLRKPGDHPTHRPEHRGHLGEGRPRNERLNEKRIAT
jgi:nucleotide-binding universal stress UspA family protein